MGGWRQRATSAGFVAIITVLLAVPVLGMVGGAPVDQIGTATSKPPPCNAVFSSVDVGTGPIGLAMNPSSSQLYVSNQGSNNLSILNSSSLKVVSVTAIGSSPRYIVTDPDSGELYAANYGGDNITVLNASSPTIHSSITVGSSPNSIAYDSAKHLIYVANTLSNNLSVVDPSINRVIKNINLTGANPSIFTIDPLTTELWITEWGSALVEVINTTSWNIVSTLHVGTYPAGEVYFPPTQEVFITNDGSNNVSVINATTHKNIASIGVGTQPNYIALDPATDDLFVTNLGSSNITVIDGLTLKVVRNIPVGGNPDGALYDGKSAILYTANAASNNVSAINPSCIPVLASVSATPSSGTFYTGASGQFSADSVCLYGRCSATTSYSWNLTKNIGTLTPSPGGTVTFTAGAAVGNATLFVNATLNNKTVRSQPVLITVNLRPLVANVTLSSYTIQNGTSVTATAHLGNASAPSYSWTLNGTGSALCSSNPTCTFSLSHPAKYEVNLTVTDSGRTAWSQAPLTVYNGSKVTPLQGSIALSANDTYPGTSVWVIASASGGQSPYSYSWKLNGSAKPWTGADVPFTSHGAGNYSFTVLIGDSVGQNVTKSVVLTVLRNGTAPPPITVVLKLSANDTHPGTPVWINATASGGQSTYFYSWTKNGSAYPGSTSSVAFFPAGAGNYSFAVTVSDPIGQKTTKGAVLTVLPNSTKPGPLAVSLTANATQIHAGDSVTLTGVASGGVVPYTYSWSLNGTNASSLGTSATLSLTMLHPGNYTYRLWVVDKSGQVASSTNVTVEVLPSSTSGAHHGAATNAFSIWVLLAIIVLAAALLLLLFFVFRRRGQRESKKKATPAAARWVAQPIPPKPPADYLEGISVAPAEWDESAEPASAYGSYTLGPKEHAEFAETASGAPAKPSPELDAYRPFSMKVTPGGIQVEEVPPAKPEIVDAEFVSAPTEKEEAVEGPAPSKASGSSPNDVYAVMQSLARKPRTLDGIKQEVRLSDDDLFTVLAGLSKAKFIARGARKGSEVPLFVLTPLGRKVARRFIKGEAKEDQEELKSTERTALPAGKGASKSKTIRLEKGTILQDVHQIGEERESLDEASPFKTLRPEDVNPQLKGKKALPKEILQPMEMRVQSDRGTDTRNTSETTDVDKRTQMLLERAKKDRKGKDKFGVEQKARPEEKE